MLLKLKFTQPQNLTLVLVYFLDRDQTAIEDPAIIQLITNKLKKNLNEPNGVPVSTNLRRSRQVKHFNTPTDIEFREINKHLTEITITTKDISGLLSRIGQAFRECEIRMHDAKINTVGEKAEDTFIISSIDNKALEEHENQRLKQTLIRAITH